MVLRSTPMPDRRSVKALRIGYLLLEVNLGLKNA